MDIGLHIDCIDLSIARGIAAMPPKSSQKAIHANFKAGKTGLNPKQSGVILAANCILASRIPSRIT
jgi:hypothetical protein